MDNKQVMKWVVAATARGVAWALVAWLSMDAAQSQSLGLGIAEALGALAVAGISIWTSCKGRKKLKAEFPPGD